MKYMKIIRGRSKGQAFDTFKLMIAAVVAVAILGILMGILQTISLPTSGFDDTLKTMLSKASAGGSVQASQSDITFSSGSSYDGTAKVYKDLTMDKPVQFKCAISTQCTPPALGPTLTILMNFKAKIYVGCGSTKCCVGIGVSPGTCP